MKTYTNPSSHTHTQKHTHTLHSTTKDEHDPNIQLFLRIFFYSFPFSIHIPMLYTNSPRINLRTIKREFFSVLPTSSHRFVFRVRFVFQFSPGFFYSLGSVWLGFGSVGGLSVRVTSIVVVVFAIVVVVFVVGCAAIR